MAGFGGGDGDAHRVGVAHFADDNDVRCLAQRGSQRRRKIGRVGADFDLLDNTAHVLVLVLDRIFDDDDVARLAAIDVVDERGHRRRFTRSGGTADQHQATRHMSKLLNRWRKPKLFELRHTRRQHANRGGRSSLLAMKIDAEPPGAGDAIRRIGDLTFAILLQGVARQCGNDRRFDLRPIEQAGLDLAYFPVDAHARRRAGDEQQVAGATLNDHREPAVEPLGDTRIVVLRFLLPVEMIQAGSVIHHQGTCWDSMQKSECVLARVIRLELCGACARINIRAQHGCNATAT